MVDRFTEELRTLFGRTPTVVCDSPEGRDWARALGLPAIAPEDIQSLNGTPAVVICTTAGWYSELDDIRDTFAETEALWLPLAAFPSQISEQMYSLDRLENATLHNAPSLHSDAVASIAATSGNARLFDGRGTDMLVDISEEFAVATLHDPHPAAGDLTSALSYFEVESEWEAHETPPVRLSGRLGVDGMVFARGPGRFLDRGTLERAAQLAKRIAASTVVLEADNSTIIGLSVNGVSWQGALEELTAGVPPRIIEFSIGTNRMASVAWEINSPLNEGMSGIHVGVGDGYSALHCDFVCSGLKLSSAHQLSTQ